jgi:hypothetical protein
MESPEMIDAWLKTATRDLCDAAKERIALEIKAHFNDAVAAHEAEGQSSETAQRLALDELGGARAAAKRFRSRHLTVKEDEFLNQQMILLGEKPSKLEISIRCLVPIVIFTLIALFGGSIFRDWFLMLLVFVGVVISRIFVWAYCRRLTRSQSHNTAVKQISLIKSANVVCWFMIFFVIMFWDSNPTICFGSVFFEEFRWPPIYFKMKNDQTLAG